MKKEIKSRFDLIPAKGIKKVADVFTKGLEFYEENEWKKGHAWSEFSAKLERSFLDFKAGNDVDKDGLYNLAKVASHALMLLDLYETYPQGDDRYDKNTNTPKIVLDVDDVVADFIGHYQNTFNVKLNKYWSSSYGIKGNLDKLKEDKEFWLNLPKLRNVPFEVHAYVSSRSIPVEWTQEWIEKNGLPCAPVYHVPWDTSKVELLKKIGCDILIDDKYANFQEVTKAGMFCYLMDAAHNKHYNVGHRRIFDLNILGYGK